MDASKANSIKAKRGLSPSRALRKAMRDRGAKVGSITYFYSGKNDIDIVFPNEILYASGLLLEADERVRGYEADPDRIRETLHVAGFAGSVPQLIVRLWEQRPLLLKVTYLARDVEKDAQQQLANAIGCDYQVWDINYVQTHERLLHDWLQIAPVLAQSHLAIKTQYDFLHKLLLEACAETATLAEIKKSNLAPWDVVFATIFFLAQRALLTTDLHIHPLSAETSVRRRETNSAYQKIFN